MGRVIGGRYELGALLGRGGMGEVWAATDLLIGRPVAVKTLPQYHSEAAPQEVESFFREARTVGSLSHRGIVTVHDVGQDTGGTLYLVMELIPGRDLGRVLKDGLPEIATAVGWTAQVADALAAAHASNVLHRDLKPANLMLVPGGAVKILDFGIARYTAATGAQASRVIGTVAYMPPERLRGKVGDARGDLYSLGCLLHELLTGTPPFGAGEVAALLFAHLDRTPEPPGATRPGVPAALDGLVLDLLAKDPARRPPSAMEVAGRLTGIAAALAAAARAVRPTTPGVRLTAVRAAAPTSAGQLTAVLPAVAAEGPQSLGGARVRAGHGPGARPATTDGAHPALSRSVAELTALAAELADQKRYREAVAVAVEAVGASRRLADADPGSHEADLARRLHNLGGYLGRSGNWAGALEALGEAVDLWRGLVPADPATHLPGLAATLSALGTTLGWLGRREESLDVLREAVDQWRALTQADPGTHEGALARVLYILGDTLGELGRWEEALVPLREAVELRRELALADPATFEPGLATALYLIGFILGELGHREEALGPLREVVELRRRLDRTGPLAPEPGLARTLASLGDALKDLGRWEESLAPLREAVELRRRLALADPDTREPGLARTLYSLGNTLRELERWDESLAPLLEAEKIVRRLALTDPATYEPRLPATLLARGFSLGRLGRREEQLLLFREAEEITRRWTL
ncbi:tetratricopeptide repeat-containing serine/threonine protein kinase [Kitasatospora sp. NBC_00240]|uniref:serine/threonine-protein kinase n=1 Tax=Kitasatospora sp. NBC_00240 TaxID=2903567 RepID=UPI002259DD7D|nr:serine/threonine-protein kinase [Kitasatospora sp. NBC_00240]MCX5211129.1 tetratricopeptide repeat-containing serine/threonine protein kinase [Kitasatospora sp. NBC_00240]